MKLGNATLEQHLAWAESELTPPARQNPMSAREILHVVATFRQALKTLQNHEDAGLTHAMYVAPFEPPDPSLIPQQKSIFADPPAGIRPR